MASIARSTFTRAMRARVAMAMPSTRRCFSAAAAQLKQTITKELKYEQENYQRPGVVSDFMAKDNWSFEEKEGDVRNILNQIYKSLFMCIFDVKVNMMLKKELGNKSLVVEWQLSAPTDFEMEEVYITNLTNI